MIYIIIPVFNRVNQTLDCLKSIEEQNFKDIATIVVNDGSTDNTEQLIHEKYPNITVLEGTGGLFWTGAIAYGINYVMRSCNIGDWVLLLNNDVTMEKDTLDSLHKLAVTKNRKFLLNAVSLDSRDKDTIIKSGTIIRSWFFNLSNHVHHGESYNKLKEKSLVEVDLLTGRCLLHPVEVFLQVGNYDSYNFQHYGGDDEFSSRAKRFGYSLGISMNSKVYLDTSSTGIKSSIFKSGPKYLFSHLFSIRSSSNVITKLKFTLRVVPNYAKVTYFLVGVTKSIILLFKN